MSSCKPPATGKPVIALGHEPHQQTLLTFLLFPTAALHLDCPHHLFAAAHRRKAQVATDESDCKQEEGGSLHLLADCHMW
mmetsp:Transcript_34178/g.66790  ORF Transcript_34178/g.66790 Transcript_34178/m.66790 type:complete len:80 (+) Transcript_34178:88-327(+)